ncbi:MAG: hypothetical protein NTV36_01475 [Candidatus Staskawiczbacteria bacterium]|nr:hypothetical protein [Candidatus Staskawiczbacteria bacterium]
MKNEKLQVKFFDPQADIAAKFDFYIKIVVGVLLIAMLTMLLMVGGLLLDAWHFNSAIYREYSEKNQSLEQAQKINDLLLSQTDSQQKQITELKNQIVNLLKK